MDGSGFENLDKLVLVLVAVPAVVCFGLGFLVHMLLF
jgi:hypothetical protein